MNFTNVLIDELRRYKPNLQRCLLCGYSKIVEKHHVIPRRSTSYMFENSFEIIAQLRKGTIPICPNCHKLIHLGRLTVFGLRLKNLPLGGVKIIRTKLFIRLLKKYHSNTKVLIRLSPFRRTKRTSCRNGFKPFKYGNIYRADLSKVPIGKYPQHPQKRVKNRDH